MQFMGAGEELLKDYKRSDKVNGIRDPDRRKLERERRRITKSQAVFGLWDWLCNNSWIDRNQSPPRSDGHIDALACAMVAAAIGGLAFSGLELIAPVLATEDARTGCDFPEDDALACRPSLSLVGPSPFYLLATKQYRSIICENDR
jgi:hypothetical protein